MSLFGTSPDNDSPSLGSSKVGQSRNSLFEEDDEPMTRSDGLFNDDDLGGSGRASPWDMPTPRKQQSRADLLKGLLAGVDVPDSYIEAFDDAVREDGSNGKVTSAGITKALAAAKLSADSQARITNIITPASEEGAIGRNEFNVLLALIGLAQEDEHVTLDGVDERRRSKSFFHCVVAVAIVAANRQVLPPSIHRHCHCHYHQPHDHHFDLSMASTSYHA
jgi:sorting nexin-8